MSRTSPDPLAPFHDVARAWFLDRYGTPTAAQRDGWAAIAAGQSTLIQAPTGSGKTLAAFYWAINNLMFGDTPGPGCRVLYVSPLKALAVDVDRNLRTPLDGLSAWAAARSVAHTPPRVAVRTGDTSALDRSRFRRHPAEILITTPESLYLLLTSQARAALASVRTVIIDEIHALVPTKRGAHLALSLERLEALCGPALQRIGLSATQRPLEEVAHFLGGAATPSGPVNDPDTWPRYRPVTIVATGERKHLELRVDVPVEDMTQLPDSLPVGPDGERTRTRITIWNAIQPQLLDLVRSHRSTLMFVNSRRSAERLAGALNEMAGAPLVRAHHGSLAREQRVEVEEALKAGQLRGLVATSSLELGIDMGAIDLVIQIEAPPSVASGLQRAGRGGHHVHATSRAVIVPKFRSDLLACAAVTRAMHDGQVESTRFLRCPLDVLAQQLVAMVAVGSTSADTLFTVVRGAAPFVPLTRRAFDDVLDMLSGRYPQDDFAELRPRVTWNRSSGIVSTREGSGRLAVTNGGTIPDRGLYGVFMSGARPGHARVGELDEEMVFETRVGETFVLGASTWRVDDITLDRVLVSPAPGEPGKVPFWKADAAGRPVEFGRAIGALSRELREMPPAAARTRLITHHDLTERAAENLLRYLADQYAAVRAVPDDRTVIVERCRDEVGAWRVCVLTPFGSRVHGPWAMAASALIKTRHQLNVLTTWTDDGFVLRFPETDDPPDVTCVAVPSADLERLVTQHLGATAHFAARFREAAGRALLLPRRRAGQRAPLWQQRKRAGDLLASASRFPEFPILLETYRECLRDDFDVPACIEILGDLERGALRQVVVDSDRPSPFAAALLFGYTATYLYDGDAPLAERKAHALTIDIERLRDLVGAADLRTLLRAEDIAAVERSFQGLTPDRAARSADGLHDLLLRLGDLSRDELRTRCEGPVDDWLAALGAEGRTVVITVGDDTRVVAIEHAAQYRDGLGVTLPAGMHNTWLAPAPDALAHIIGRFARCHGPFPASAVTTRFAISPEAAVHELRLLAARGKTISGEFTPGGTSEEWCSVDVLRVIRQRSLAHLRHDTAPVDTAALGRFSTTWHGVGSGRRGLDALLDVIESLQGAPLIASVLERQIFPCRLDGYDPADLDRLSAAGEIRWLGLESLGLRDGRIALYLTDTLERLSPPRPDALRGDHPIGLSPRECAVLGALARSGASYFGPLHEAAGGGFPGETVGALWALVWKGLVTNDAFQALRQYVTPPERRRHPRPDAAGFRSRRTAPAGTEGRWALVGPRLAEQTPTEWVAAVAEQLLARHGILTRDTISAETLSGGFGSIYPVLRTLEEAGRIRRGYFVAGIAATQFARPAAIELLRTSAPTEQTPRGLVLAATDPANPYGSALPWPVVAPGPHETAPSFARAAGAYVCLVDGALVGYWRQGSDAAVVVLSDDDVERARQTTALAVAWADIARTGEGHDGGLLVATINGCPADRHPCSHALTDAGFVASPRGYRIPRSRRAGPAAARHHVSEEEPC